MLIKAALHPLPYHSARKSEHTLLASQLTRYRHVHDCLISRLLLDPMSYPTTLRASALRAPLVRLPDALCAPRYIYNKSPNENYCPMTALLIPAWSTALSPSDRTTTPCRPCRPMSAPPQPAAAQQTVFIITSASDRHHPYISTQTAASTASAARIGHRVLSSRRTAAHRGSRLEPVAVRK